MTPWTGQKLPINQTHLPSHPTQTFFSTIPNKMVSLKTVQASNASLRAIPNITALFVGGTSGIGQSTLRQLARHADSPTAYIIGRSQARATPFLSELQQTNPKGRFHFIEADASLARNVDTACKEILAREKHLNFLFMTPGGISLGGRNGALHSRPQYTTYTTWSYIVPVQRLTNINL